MEEEGYKPLVLGGLGYKPYQTVSNDPCDKKNLLSGPVSSIILLVGEPLTIIENSLAKSKKTFLTTGLSAGSPSSPSSTLLPPLAVNYFHIVIISG